LQNARPTNPRADGASVHSQRLSEVSRFAIPGSVVCEAGPNEQIRLAITTASARAQLSLFGAHLTSYQPAGAADLLWLDPDKFLDRHGGISGGIPLCWPWFGRHPSGEQMTMHGFARVCAWTLLSIEKKADAITARLRLRSEIPVDGKWPAPFQAIATFVLGDSLSIELETTNISAEPMLLREAFHTYFAVGDVARVAVNGLEGCAYLDNDRKLERCPPAGAPLIPSGPVDLVYEEHTGACRISDEVLARRIDIEKSGSRTTVVWNPFGTARSHPDWRHFLCVESANCLNQMVAVQPGGVHRLQATYRVSAGT
jgi:glucose-6-phosphate 1-epimerase